MTLQMTAARSVVAIFGILAVCGCAAGQATPTDSCMKIHAIGRTLLKQDVDQVIKAKAVAENITANPECYDSGTVAVAHTGLVQLNQPTPAPPTWLNSIGD